jgi:hypothetical protein
MDAHSADEPAMKRRKVRKGTHSCWECRRRKVRCIFEPPDDVSCITCKRRGSDCVGQDIVDDSTVSSAKSGIPGGNDSCNGSIDLALVPSSVRADGMFRTPISNQQSPAAPVAYTDTYQRLFQALPSHRDIEILLRHMNGTSAFHNQCGYKYDCSSWNEARSEKELVPDLRSPESHPVLLARQMFLFAAALQSLSPAEHIIGLSKHHHILMDAMVEAAISIVNTNEAFIASLEGLENFVMECFYHINSGNMRRAWLTIRRAVTAAQLLCLHRPSRYRFSRLSHQRVPDPEAMWSRVVCTERVLSLLLGLPTSTNDVTFTESTGLQAASSTSLPALLAPLIARVLQRNQLDLSQQALDMTDEIDQELIGIAERMTPSFWQPPAFEGLVKHSREALRESRRAFDHMCYYVLVIQLHLPHMLCPSNVSQRLYSKIACVNASRDILTREIAVRTFDPMTACWRMNDFLALIAGMTLMLAHAVSHCGQGSQRLLTHQRLGDRAIVEQALDCMKSISEMHEDVLAVRIAALLKDLLMIEEEAAHASRDSLRGRHDKHNDGEGERSMLIMRVPYVGAIKLSRQGISAVPLTNMEQDEDCHRDVSIGGIGSIKTNNMRPSHSDRTRTTSGVVHPRVPAVPQSDTVKDYQTVAHDDYLTFDDNELFPDQAEMFPAAAAGLDDWVFQGMDTAFFDTLLRGNEYQATGELDTV